MRRRPITKVLALDARHPGLRERVHTMFEELWPTRDIKHMIHARYGERLSLSCVETYKRHHWRAQRESAQQMSAALAASGEVRILNSEC